MNTGFHSKEQHFDNLSYISDGRDRISYVNDPYGLPTRDASLNKNDVILQPNELNRSRHNNDAIYAYRSGQDNLYGYNNAAFSDISGNDLRRSSIPSNYENFHPYQKVKPQQKKFQICSKYWFIFIILIIIILIAIGVGVGVGVGIARSKSKSNECHLSCRPSENIVQVNSTYCQCQLNNQCELQPPVCGQFPCIKFDGVGYECNCTTGFQHPPITNDLKRCEDIDECQNNETCGEHQICNNTIGNYTCTCETGYDTIILSDKMICQDKNECAEANTCSNGICKNTNGSFICVCNPGFILDIFNPSHCEDINECFLTHNCTNNNEICENTVGSFKCICADGYRRDTNEICQNINECDESNTTCDINSRCEDRNGSFACCMKSITDQCIECGFDYRNINSNVSNHSRRTRMIDGQSVKSGDFPWVAALLIKKDYYQDEPRYVCSASLVSSWNVITAAHCLDERLVRLKWTLTKQPDSFRDLFDIRIGVHNLSLNSTDLLQSQSYSIENFTLNSGYQSLSSSNALVKNDIALIKLTKRIERSSNIDWICLPTLVNVYDQKILKVVSYNHDEDSIQQELDVRVLNNQQNRSECQGQFYNIAEDAFCAISQNTTSLLNVGDSGAGAMLFDNNNHWELAGIMSKTGLQKAYSAMTNVSMHIEWLKSLVER